MVDFGRVFSSVGSHQAIASEAQPNSEAEGLKRPVTRRNFIVWYLAGLLTATVVAAVMPILVYIYPPGGNSKRQDVPIKLDKPLSELENGNGVKFTAPAETGFRMTNGGGDNAAGKIAFAGYAVKDEAGKLNVFAINCSHLGCSVNLVSDKQRFECPCHGSMFNLGGQVIHGPAIWPLSNLGWKQAVDSSGKVIPDQIIVEGYQLKGIG